MSATDDQLTGPGISIVAIDAGGPESISTETLVTGILSLDVAAAGIVGTDFYPALTFNPLSFEFSTTTGASGPLAVNLGKADTVNGVKQLQSAASRHVIIPLVIMVCRFEPGRGTSSTVETITLSKVTVSMSTDEDGIATAKFDYQAANMATSFLGNVECPVALAKSVLDEAAGFCGGTRLATATGTTAIENLQIGDALRTAGGATRRIRWLGRRLIDCSSYSDPSLIRPIRIAKDAIAPGVPSHDLRLSPGHRILIEGALVQVRDITNDKTIIQEAADQVEYWQVEFDTHDTLKAEGLAAASYLDTGSRASFTNGNAFLEMHPDFQPLHWTDACAPLRSEGPAASEMKTILLARSIELAPLITDEPDLHIMADGKRIDPILLRERRLAFMLEENIKQAELRSRSFVPAQIDPSSRDQRRLGVCVTRIELNGGEIPLDQKDKFVKGWHDLEEEATGRRRRWTNGCVELPPGVRLVLLELGNRGYYPQPRNEASAVVVPLRGPRT